MYKLYLMVEFITHQNISYTYFPTHSIRFDKGYAPSINYLENWVLFE